MSHQSKPPMIVTVVRTVAGSGREATAAATGYKQETDRMETVDAGDVERGWGCRADTG